MPRLPTILVIGSHAISTTSVSLVEVLLGSVRVMGFLPSPGLLEAGGELAALAAPGGLLVDGGCRDAAQPADRLAVDRAAAGGQLGARRLVHERHELVREAGHR